MNTAAQGVLTMPRQSRVLIPPADHAFRISWDLSRDTPVNSPTTLNSYLNAENPLIPQEQEITNLCQWSIGLARGIPSPPSPLRTTPTLAGSTALPTTRHHHRQRST